MSVLNDKSATPSIVRRVAAFIERFVYLENPKTYLLVAVWVIGTHCYDAFDFFGYLFAYSPAPQSGKSRLLEVLSLLVHNSTGVLESPTESVLFRTAHGHTQLLDEADSWQNRSALNSVLNSGFQKGGVVARTERNENKAKGEWTVRKFSTYAPRAIAGVGLDILSKTTKDRTFPIPMMRQKPSERREKLRIRRIGDEAAQLKAAIADWVKERQGEIETAYAGSFPALETLADRTIDVSEPLFAICTIAAPDALLELLHAIEYSRQEESEVSDNLRILAELGRLDDDPLIGNATELAERLNLDGFLGPSEVTGALRSFGFQTKTVRLNDDGRRRYVLPQARIAELLERYGCGNCGSSVVGQASDTYHTQPTEKKGG